MVALSILKLKPFRISCSDIMNITHGISILTFLDFHARKIEAKIMKTKESKTIIQKLSETLDKMGNTLTFITDSGKKFTSKKSQRNAGITRYHSSYHKCRKPPIQYDRIEIVHRNIWQEIRKSLDEKTIEIIIQRSNNTWQRALALIKHGNIHEIKPLI